MTNADLFRKIADKIEFDPESYDQNTWGCGTSHCIAGHAAALTGCRPITEESNEWETVKTPNGDDEFVESYARDALGITSDDADELFDCTWRPRAPYSVSQALRMIADGTSVSAVSE